MIEIADMRCFVDVVESGGFNRAATRLGLSKSIVSRRIARIEGELGARLLSRTTRGISPTDAGLEFKTRSERILAEIDAAREAVAEHGGGLVGRLRISAGLIFGVRHIAPVLTELAMRHPKLEIEVSYSDRFVDLIGDRFDAAIRIGTLRDPSLVARRIAPVRVIPVASPDYLANHGRPKTPADLAGHECLIYTGSTSPDWHFQSGKRTLAVRPAGRLRSDNGTSIADWAIAGLGIAMLPTFMLDESIHGGALEPLLLDYPAPELGIYVVRPPGDYVSAKVRLLIDTLVAQFGGEPYWDRCLMATRK
jgi:DNA-binding transcriptional LysR family regulator